MDSLELDQKIIQSIKRALILCSIKKPDSKIFYELCYYICCTRSPSKDIKAAINKLQDCCFYECNLGLKKISGIIKEIDLSRKAEYLQYARNHFKNVISVINNENLCSTKKRNWLYNNIKGLTLCTASAFLINQGYTDIAVLDWRLTNILGLKEGPILDKNEYKKIEDIFLIEAKKLKISLTEFNAYQWFSKLSILWNNCFLIEFQKQFT